MKQKIVRWYIGIAPSFIRICTLVGYFVVCNWLAKILMWILKIKNYEAGYCQSDSDGNDFCTSTESYATVLIAFGLSFLHFIATEKDKKL